MVVGPFGRMLRVPATSYYHELEATHDDRAERRRRIRLKQGKRLGC